VTSDGRKESHSFSLKIKERKEARKEGNIVTIRFEVAQIFSELQE
jgi:hypothetical protein